MTSAMLIAAAVVGVGAVLWWRWHQGRGKYPQTRAKRKSMNPAYRPMLATLVDEPFDDKRWVFETKWDGFRLMTEKRGHAVRLWSRNGIDVTNRYAVLLPALQKIDGSCVIDGELCALDAHGRSRFQLLQNALNKKFDRNRGGLRSEL